MKKKKRNVPFVEEILYLYSGNLRRTEWTEVKEVMKSFEVKEVREVREVKDNSLASENFADVAAARGIVSNFCYFLNS